MKELTSKFVCRFILMHKPSFSFCTLYSYEILSSGLFQCTNQSSPFVQYLAAKELLYKHGDMKDDNSIIFSSNNK